MDATGYTSSFSGINMMTIGDRRSIERARISKGALLSFAGRPGVFACTVYDITNSGAGIRLHDLRIIPLEFALTLDNFSSLRRCRLIWREGDFSGVAFDPD
ncbi:PilZ domain-containing protein [Bradyrhizobium australiense]|uniref:PilZ domain-containing protein n=1 Tax=Bradyrhizobium australiense TaxID=2721161 RepID=A0A7Y4GXY0_9BRAD|nr:PilZ domain-containing protein [Bradyrhizobium australiense]NOJ43684.1 PilZ domain-containing protein [Bradyrhizobium australiense]